MFPKAVVEYFFKNRTKSSFDAMAKAGAAKRQNRYSPSYHPIPDIALGLGKP